MVLRALPPYRSAFGTISEIRTLHGRRRYLPNIYSTLPEPLIEETRRIVVEAMETLPADFSVPLKVEVKTGRTWSGCK